jgi:ribosome maturation factor RimP
VETGTKESPTAKGFDALIDDRILPLEGTDGFSIKGNMSGKDKLIQTLDQISQLAESVAQPLGLCIVDVKFGQQGKRRTLEVTIHRQSGSVSLDDCEQVSRRLEQLLDDAAATNGPIVEGAYLLEVQSPGIDRQLKTEREFRSFVGQKVLVQAKQQVADLGSRFTATLVGLSEGKLTLMHARSVEKKVETTQEQLTLEVSNLAQVRLHPDLLHKSS